LIQFRHGFEIDSHLFGAAHNCGDGGLAAALGGSAGSGAAASVGSEADDEN